METISQTQPDQIRTDVRDYLLFMCESSREAAAIEDFCHQRGGYDRIAAFLTSAGVELHEAANLAHCSTRTKRSLQYLKQIALAHYTASRQNPPTP